MASLRHRIFQLSLASGASTLLLSALVDFFEPHSEPLHSGLLALVALVFLGLAAALRATKRLWLNQLAYVVVLVSFVFEFAFSLQEVASGENYPGMLAEVFVWAPVIYAAIFTLNRSVQALRHALIIYLATLVMGVTFLFTYDARGLPLPLKAFGDLYLGTAVMIALLYIFVRRNEELLELRTLFKAQLAATDHLTGLYNRRKLQAALEVELARAAHAGQPLAVMLYDLDHFKRVNDTYGHRAGDEVLKETARRVKGLLRASDHFGRWGGEEFLIVVPGLTLEPALRCAERLREAIAVEPIGLAGHVTASFGAAAWQPGDSAESLCARADAALYRAKAAGRDRVQADQSRVAPLPETISPIG